MLDWIIDFSIKNKLIIILFTLSIAGFGIYALTQISIGAVPDVTNNQVQVITVSRDLATEDVEQFITYPIELEMANLPGIKEIRSISKFGLSVVTIVFEDNIGTYLPRQLIAEKIQSVSDKIPRAFGTPTMGPISTGLGEIYQYTLDTRPGYDTMYSTMELRTLQDWVVKRQLSGIPGVIEINTWGGYLKQYEVSINPEKLRAMNISIYEVYNAVNENNSIAGGSYIEKENESYFIRGEGMVGSIEDINNIIVKKTNGIPVFIKDVAQVNFGYATRFGAITGNGEGEKVLGQVMMLKGANSNEVINRVKTRVAEIQKNLPEGIFINPIVDRSELIGRTSFTIAENLILGCLIVIFVVVLLLGNFRSGLVVASIIPLSLLFALSMMYLFDIDANLMSLGAIDFGIIIDGAVIIVEYIAYKITTQGSHLLGLSKSERKKEVNKIAFSGASKMMHSAFFGQLIIIIVFIPILSLKGVEGKMFTPMALTFCFALIGAMILCFTFVPVASSLFLKPAHQQKSTISDKIMNFLKRSYKPVIRYALVHKTRIIVLSLVLLGSTVFIFSRMGGEFVPTLDEGDFVIQPVLKTGTSLSKTIEATTRIEQILLKEFPEVEQVVSRIGAAEVPTDPMSMEETDVIIKLKPKSEWVTARSKEDLAEKFKAALSVIPGVEYEFTQPIEMRFNELITGVRADLAIKIFGEDLDILNSKAQEIRSLIEGVEGAADITIEKIQGLPQMSIKYDRKKLARYDMNVTELNNVVSMGFAGVSAGNIFEGEKRFDLVVKLNEKYRSNIEDVENLHVNLSNGNKVPLRELADISYTKGPSKISRDDTKRRIVVGINVRNRDLESVVDDVSEIIENKVELPVGYSISYGGQFENLRSARQRLMVAVPVALLLIFIMLHFALSSFKEALMVFSAIPLAAVGGVLLLWFRGMPFSISAGIGFIALFGIAVLNGLVLIEHLNALKKKDITDIHKLIVRGACERLRPVLLTASAAALGFLPMAVSTSAGAEVQRPLATVVIGGLVTATLLTMVVLPVLYSIFDKPISFKNLNKKKMKLSFWAILLLLIFMPISGFAQSRSITLDEAIQMAKEQNSLLKAERLKIERSEVLISSAWDIDKTSVYYNYDENNIAENGFPIKVWGIQQTMQFPTVYSAQKKVYESRSQMQIAAYEMAEQNLTKQVAQSYYQIVYLQHKQRIYQYLDSIYSSFSQAAARRYELGETNYLEKLAAKAQMEQIQITLQQLNDDINIAYQELYKLLMDETGLTIAEHSLKKIQPSDSTANRPGLKYYEMAKKESDAINRWQKQQWFPELQFEYFQGTNGHEQANVYEGVQIGVAIPLWFGSRQSQVQASSLQKQIVDQEAMNYQLALNTKINQLNSQLRKYNGSITYYENSGKALSAELLHTAIKSYQSGEIDFFRYTQIIEEARNIELNYLDNLSMYNQTILELKYITL